MLAMLAKGQRVRFIYHGNVTNGHKREGTVNEVAATYLNIEEKTVKGTRFRSFSNRLIDLSTLAVLS